MILQNTNAVLLLGLLLGIATSFNFIGSEAYLLSILQPVYTLYVTIGANLSFAVFLRFFSKFKGRFSIFSLALLFFYAAALASLNFSLIPGTVRAIGWFYIAILGIAFFMWMPNEIAVRYLDPARAHSYFSYLVTAMSIGTILTAGAFRALGNEMGVNHTIWLSVIFFALAMVLVGIQFLPSSNIEVHFKSKKDAAGGELEVDKRAFGSFVKFFIAITVLLGIFKVTQAYVVKVALKEMLGSYDAISAMIANYLLISGVATIIISAAMGKAIRARHVSPVRMYGVYIFLALAAAVVCAVKNALYYYVGLEVVKRVFERAFYSPASEMTVASFIGKFRLRLKALQNFYYFTIIPIPFAILFSLPIVSKSPYQKLGILILLILCLISAFTLLISFKKRFRDILYAFIKSGDKAVAVLATQAVSFLKPKKYEDFLVDILGMSPKKILRKNIILSLAYSPKSSIVNVITNEFGSNKEEIQVAVLDALFVSRDYRAVQFMIDVVKVQEKPKSLRVRINATKMVAAIYGRKAIPFLLNGLKNPDARVVANTLETLALYKDKKLIPYFIEFIHNDTPRIRANALMALSYFRKTRDIYRFEMTKILQGDDINMKASALFVAGKQKDRRIKDFLFSTLYSPHKDVPLIKRNLAWALLRFGCEEGYALFDEIFTAKEEGTESAIMHHFSQMEREMRFDIIKYLASKHLNDPAALTIIGDKLRNTAFDFHEEIDYFDVIVSKGVKA